MAKQISSPNDDAPVAPWYRQFWPWFLISLPATVVVASIVTINLAIKSNDGLVTDDYYKKGLGIHREADALEKARELGVNAVFTVPGKREKLALSLALDKNIAVGELRVALRHPTRSQHDLSLAMRPVGPYAYEATLPDELPQADWIIQLIAPESGWHLHGRISLHKDRRVVLR